MSAFDQSQWADTAFAQEYRDHADHYLPERPYLFHVLRSYYRAFVARPGAVRVCDLGCGDGVLTAQLLQEDPNVEALLVDGSEDMLASARRKLGERPNLRFLRAGFDELIRDASALGQFDFIVSGFAIHHVNRADRRALFWMAGEHLEAGGSFLNIEVGLPESPAHLEWHYQLWREWIARHGEQAGVGAEFAGVPDKARTNPDNQYSPLGEQLEDLSAAGFEDVACHYRNGIFTIYSGRRG